MPALPPRILVLVPTDAIRCRAGHHIPTELLTDRQGRRRRFLFCGYDRRGVHGKCQHWLWIESHTERLVLLSDVTPDQVRAFGATIHGNRVEMAERIAADYAAERRHALRRRPA